MPAQEDYNSLYYDLKCINVFRESKLTNTQFKELVSKIEVRPYNKDEIITELDKETKAALYLVVTGSVWLARDGMAPIKLPSGCNFGEELLKASEGSASGMVPSPYSVKAADDTCVCAVLTMDVCREVFDIDKAEKHNDANLLMLQSPFPRASTLLSKQVQNTKIRRLQKKRDEDEERVSSKPSKSMKVKKEKKKVKEKAKVKDKTETYFEDTSELTETKLEEDVGMILQSTPNITDSQETLDFETADEEPSLEFQPESGDSNDMGQSVTLNGIDQSETSLFDNEKSGDLTENLATSFSELKNTFSGNNSSALLQGSSSSMNSIDDSMENSARSFSELKNKFSRNITAPMPFQGSSSSMTFNDTKKQLTSPVMTTGTSRRWRKDAFASPRLPTSDIVIEKTYAEDNVADVVSSLKLQRPTEIEPVRARRGSVAERFLSKLVRNTTREERPKPLLTEEDAKQDTTALMLEGSQAHLVGLTSDSESESEDVRIEQSGIPESDGLQIKQEQPVLPPPRPPPDELNSPVRAARKMYENQIQQNSTMVRRTSLKSSVIPLLDGSSHSKGSASSDPPSPTKERRRFSLPVICNQSDHSKGSTSSDPPSPTKERRRFSLPVQCNQGLFTDLDQEGSESFSNDDGHIIREVVIVENQPEVIHEADEEDEEEGDQSLLQQCPTEIFEIESAEVLVKEILPPPPPPPSKDCTPPKASKHASKKEKKRISAATTIIQPDLSSPIQPKKTKDPLLSPRKRKDKASFIARIARFEDQTGKSGVPVVRQAGNVYQIPTKLPTNFKAPRFPKTDQEEKMLKNAIKKRFVFENLPDKTIKLLTAAFEKIHVPTGTELFSQGDEDKYFYVVANGQCDILIDGETYDVAKSGESFGEEALLHNSRRQATALVAKDSDLFRFDQTTFRRLLQDEATRSAVHKQALLEKLDFLENASTEQLQKLSNLLTLVKFKKGDTLAKQDTIGDKFFLIAEGSVECQDVKLGRIVKGNKILVPGDYFGKQAIFAEEPIMKADVVALTNGKAYFLSKDLRDQAMGSGLIPIHSRTLHSVKALERNYGRLLKHHDIVGLTRLIKNIEYTKGDTIVEADQDVEAAIYFVRSGKVYESEGRNLLMISEGAHFGESVFQSARESNSVKGKSTSRIIAESDCTCGVLFARDYYNHFGDKIAYAEVPTAAEPKPTMSHSELANDSSTSSKSRISKDGRNIKKAKRSSDTPSESDTAQSPQKSRLGIQLKNLEKKVCIGEGEFGQVWLVVDKEAKKQQPYVLKIQSKHHLITEGEVEVCKREKDVLSDVDHPFIIDLFDTYQDAAFVYMLMDFVPGGELFSILNDDEGRIKIHEDRARFYLLGIADALAHLHYKKYVYRDLKPENVMIDRFGYPKLIDFGFAKKVMDQTFTLCGTPAYLAPETVKSQGHNWSADHWALGILCFEMVMGFSPFYEDGIEQFELYRMIVEEKLPELEGRSLAATDFITRLLEKSPSNRLGSLARGEKDILSHKWFGDLSTAKMRERAVKAPWIPAIKSQFDTSNFDDWSGVTDKTLDKGPPLGEKHAALFEGF